MLPPTGTPLTGIDFNKRLPCGEVERARRVSSGAATYWLPLTGIDFNKRLPCGEVERARRVSSGAATYWYTLDRH